MILRQVIKSKIHKATITKTKIDYEKFFKHIVKDLSKEQKKSVMSLTEYARHFFDDAFERDMKAGITYEFLRDYLPGPRKMYKISPEDKNFQKIKLFHVS